MKVLIIDDERMPAQHLEEVIKQNCFEITSIELVYSPIEALEHLSTNFYDILFVDVEMPEVNGIELMKKLSLPSETSIIFVTAYPEYAVDAFGVDALHYIVKPVDENELIKAVRKVTKRKQEKPETEAKLQKNSISIFDGEEYHIIKIEDIVRFEADGSYTKIVEADKEYFSSRRLGVFEKKLPDTFVRCHKSHIVNLKKISKVGKGNGGYLVMVNGNIVPASSPKIQLSDFLN